MKAAVLYKPLDLRIEDIDTPKPKNGEILVKVDTSGLCPSDVKIYKYGSSNVKYPVVLGHEFTGVVYALGDDVESFSEGDKVVVAADAYCGKCEMCKIGKENLCYNPLSFGYNINGAHAEFVLVPKRFVDRGGIKKINPKISLEAMSMAEPLACTIHSLRILNLEFSDNLLVIGDGPMGLLHVIAAKALGINNIAVVGLVKWKLELAKALGASYIFNAAESPNIINDIKDIFHNGFAGVVITVVNQETISEAMKLASKGGKISVFAGLPSGQSQFTLDTNIIHYNEVSLMGSSGYTYHEFDLAYKIIEKEQDSFLKLVTHRFKLENIYDAIKIWENKDKSLKILITR
ncbi:MAG: zinc-dependent alcohol dehydrogenase [Nitrososphaeria archaeon]